MLRRSRVGTTPDMTRISAAVQRAGIDPRIWCSVAYTLSESSVDAKHGHFVDVKLLPSDLQLTCRVPQNYAGKQFGNHDGLLHQHDDIIVLIPDGDPSHGAIVIARLWGEEDVPPDFVVANQKDTVRVQEKDTHWWLTLQGAGKATVESETFTAKTEKVRLGAEDASEQVVLGTQYRSSENTMNVQVAAAFGVLQGLLTTAGASLTAAGPAVLLPPAGAAISAAGAALTAAASIATQIQTAITTFDGSATQYLSTVSKTK